MGIPEIVLLATSLVLALNMGGSGLAPAFAVSMGSGVLSRRLAVLLFTLFVLAGALLFGKFVAKTLGGQIVPAATFDTHTALAVILAATVSLFLANLLRVPQSTSWVTVFAIVVVGLEYDNLNEETLLYRLVPAWVVLPVLSFVLTASAVRIFYPLRRSNYRFYEHLSKHEWKLRALAVASSCYVAFAIGTNNVANVVGPLAATGLIDLTLGFLVIAPLFGLGALLLPSPSRTVGKGIVPIGVFTAVLSNLVVGTIILVASRLGIPQSLVQVSTASVVAISLVKERSFALMRRGVLAKIAVLWIVTPVLAASLTFALLKILP